MVDLEVLDDDRMTAPWPWVILEESVPGNLERMMTQQRIGSEDIEES